ncbi:WD40 repeat domain-containing serine/threonine protein kinase [Streptosporangium roseum]|uniref:WD40 repeat domain-containing serine/threonine protein kinase n=1 Tax=Streptosporangium roseum TaxID=2001 RepID=UPI00069077B0|nr:serine/threonine-protein kinase [Streptosporangium roseum]
MSGPGPPAAGDPERIGDYRLTRVLGDGGQGVVYLGRDPSDRQVAVKLLHVRMAADPKVRERFMREAEVTRRVAAFCTAQVLDMGITGDRPYLVSEYIPGPSLKDLVTSDGPRAGSGLDRLAVATLTALAAIHRAGIVHRDFKPDNVIMGPEGPVVIDFGIARVLDGTTTSSGLVGTPAYLSPEQLDGHQAGTASDVFSWAATMVFAATGHRAFPGDVAAAVMNAVSNREPDLAGVPERLRPLLAACLAKDPGARPAVSSLLAALTREEPVTADHRPRAPLPPPPVSSVPSPPATSSASRAPSPSATSSVSRAPSPSATSSVSRVPSRPTRRRLVAAGAVVTVLILVAVAFWLWQPEFPGTSAPSSTGLPGTSAPPSTAPSGTSAPSSSPTGLPEPSRPSSTGSSAPSPDRTPSTIPLGMPVGRPFSVRTDASSSVEAVTEFEGRQVVVSDGDSTVRVWDLATRKETGRPFTAHNTGAHAVVTELEGRQVVVSGGGDSAVRVWDLATRKQIGRPFTAHTNGITSVVVTELAGRRVIVSAGGDSTVRVWDLATREQVGRPFTGHTVAAESVVVTELAGRRVVVSAGGDGARVWDLATREQVGRPFTAQTDGNTTVTVTVTEFEGRPVVVSGAAGGDDSTVRVWDLATRKQLGRPFTGHTEGVESVVVTELQGRPVVVSGGYDGIRVWDLATREQIGKAFGTPTHGITSMLVTELEGRPVLLTGDFDGRVRVWSLGPPAPASGS